jgi:hypothetical protein
MFPRPIYLGQPSESCAMYTPESFSPVAFLTLAKASYGSFSATYLKRCGTLPGCPAVGLFSTPRQTVQFFRSDQILGFSTFLTGPFLESFFFSIRTFQKLSSDKFSFRCHSPHRAVIGIRFPRRFVVIVGLITPIGPARPCAAREEFEIGAFGAGLDQLILFIGLA